MTLLSSKPFPEMAGYLPGMRGFRSSTDQPRPNIEYHLQPLSLESLVNRCKSSTPVPPASGINSPTLMIAEKAAEWIQAGV